MTMLFLVLFAILATGPVAAQTDDITVTDVVFHQLGQVQSWPATITLQTVEFKDQGGADRAVGVRPVFADEAAMRARWPNVTPTGWTGTVRTTVWPVVRCGDGRWHTVAAIVMYDGAWGTGAPLTQPGGWVNWVYFDAALLQCTPKTGDEIGFFVTAGGTRWDNVTISVPERSNIVKVRLLANGLGVRETPAPPVPPPAPPSPVFTRADYEHLLEVLDGLRQQIEDEKAWLYAEQQREVASDAAFQAYLEATVADLRSRLEAQPGAGNTAIDVTNLAAGIANLIAQLLRGTAQP